MSVLVSLSPSYLVQYLEIKEAIFQNRNNYEIIILYLEAPGLRNADNRGRAPKQAGFFN